MYVVPFLMGPLGSPLRQGRRRDHRQHLRRAQHAHHDAHGQGRARPPRRTGRLHPLPALARRPAAPSAASSALPARTTRSGRSARATAATRCSARSASRCASPAGSGEAGGLARRAHADPRRSRVREGETHYVAGAFPRACGKTNFAMLVPPEACQGWKVWTVGDDIAWMRVGDGRPALGGQPGGGLLRRRARHEPQDQPERDDDDPAQHASSPTSRCGPTARRGGKGTTIRRPPRRIDWQGRPWTPASTEKAAHPNSRFTAPADQVPDRCRPSSTTPRACRSPRSSSAARRQRRVPLVYQALNWTARRVPRRDAVVGDHRRGDRQGRRRAPRPDGDAAVLRLQHGRLLPALARRCGAQ